jgi:FixJ family two-component response regulator
VLPQPTVFVVDPEIATRDAVRRIACMLDLHCETCDCGREFLDAAAREGYGCAVLELKIPGMSGLQVQQRLTEQGSPLAVIFLTDKPDFSIAVHAMRAGAVHFLEKPFREYELCDTIEEAVALSRSRWEASLQKEESRALLARLTLKERQVLRLISEGHARPSIASQLGVHVRTVESRRKQLMRKLGVLSQAELVRWALAANGQLR